MPKKPTSKQVLFKYEEKVDSKGNTWAERCITPIGTVLYPAVFSTKRTYSGYQKQQTGKPLLEEDYEYAAILLFDKADPMLKSMEKELNAFGKRILGVKAGEFLRLPIKDGNEKFNEDPEKFAMYKGKKFLQLSTNAQYEPPLVIDEIGNEMLSAEHMYSGCMCVAMVKFKAYDTKTAGKGLKVYWDAIKKMADGDRIGGDRSGAIQKSMEKSTAGIRVVDGKAVY